MYQVGDVVSIEDIDGDIYFAQIRGFLQDEFAQKSAVITWLIPTVSNPSHFDPAIFLPGMFCLYISQKFIMFECRVNRPLQENNTQYKICHTDGKMLTGTSKTKKFQT